MFYAKKLLSALVLPPTSLLLLALWGLWLSRRHPRFGRGVTGFALLGLLALSLQPVANTLMHSLEGMPPISEPAMARAQAIVVLGGGKYYAAPEYGTDTVSRSTLERVRYGVHLQKRSGLPLLVTGGAPFGGRPEGETTKEAIERDFGGKVRWAENESRDTKENAEFSARLLKANGISRIALVSHASHLPRAVELFERHGLEVFPAPTGYTTGQSALPSAGSLLKSSDALHEWLGILVQRLTK